jgi:hypothetical protein
VRRGGWLITAQFSIHKRRAICRRREQYFICKVAPTCIHIHTLTSTCCTLEQKTIDLFVGYQRFMPHADSNRAPVITTAELQTPILASGQPKCNKMSVGGGFFYTFVWLYGLIHRETGFVSTSHIIMFTAFVKFALHVCVFMLLEWFETEISRCYFVGNCSNAPGGRLKTH